MSTKNDDPFRSMVGMMRKEGEVNNPTPFFIGEVVQPKPLRVKIGEIEIGREQMKVCSSLLGGFMQRLKLAETATTGSTSSVGRSGREAEAFYTHSHDVVSVGVPDGTFTLLNDLNVGDEVLMLMSALSFLFYTSFLCTCFFHGLVPLITEEMYPKLICTQVT